MNFNFTKSNYPNLIILGYIYRVFVINFIRLIDYLSTNIKADSSFYNYGINGIFVNNIYYKIKIKISIIYMFFTYFIK